MASWGGHTLPGTFFIMFGIYYAIQFACRHMKVQPKRRTQYNTGKFYCCSDRLPCSVLVIEGCVKIFFICSGMMVELFYPGAPMGRLHDDNGNFTHAMNWQHATMYLFFGLSGLADIITHIASHIVPKAFDRLFIALALFVEGYLFYFHLHGRSLIDTRCHILLVLAVWPCALFCFLQIFFVNKRAFFHVLEMLSAALTMFQGMWFWQVAYILYPPNGERWDPCFSVDKMSPDEMHDHNHTEVCDRSKEHLNLSFITMFWTWELAGSIILIGFIYTIVYKWLKFRRQLNPCFLENFSELTSLKTENRNGRLLSEEDEF